MKVTEKLRRPLVEAKYLNVENTERYRCIMRIFYENYEKLTYWLYAEDVFQQMQETSFFEDYRPEQCQQDLSALAEWKNLVTIQDTRNVSTIEEFKNKKYRYMMSEYSVEIERLVIRLENLFIEGASLEPTLLERIHHNLERFESMAQKEKDAVYTWWNDLNNDFIRLNQNYQDYIRDLNSVKAEEMMHTKAFLVFKDKLIEYLRSFIKGLQKHTGVIEELLTELKPDVVEEVLDKVDAYEADIPRIDTEVSYEKIHERTQGKFQSVYKWFVSGDSGENEAGKLFDATNEIIRRITRYAAQLSEKNALGANRKEEYRKVAEIFMKCGNIQEAHKMSAMVFGIERPFHLQGTLVRESDSMDFGVYDGQPMDISVKPRIRNYSEKIKRSGIKDSREEKEKTRRQALEKLREEQKKIDELTRNKTIDFSDLPVLEPDVRRILLKWMSNALESPSYSACTEDGRPYSLDASLSKETCVVHCEDGSFTMPKLKLIFHSKETGE